MCSDPDVDVLALKPYLPRPEIAEVEYDDSITIDFPEEVRGCERDGMIWVSGFIAFKMEDESLGSKEDEQNTSLGEVYWEKP